MTWMSGARALAVGLAIAAMIDPAIRRERTLPLRVSLRSTDGDLLPPDSADSSHTRAAQLRAKLEGALSHNLEINTPVEPRATVVFGQTLTPSAIPDRGPVSFVISEPAAAARVRVMSVSTPGP